MKPTQTDDLFNQVYDRTYRKTAAYLTARCQNLSDVEDLLQETYLAVYRILDAKGEDAFTCAEAYVLSTAKSKLTDWYRSHRLIPLSLSDLSEEGNSWLSSIPDRAASPEEQMVSRDAIRAVAELVETKSPDLQQAFYLRHCFGLSYAEIGKLQKKKETSVRSSIFRLTQEISSKLERSIS
ncbi:MAG: RNA polymerase sigma factor [Oscillibacter sp.]|nr:RNA polymerase sigma factor [Oscillibacter sp.]